MSEHALPTYTRRDLVLAFIECRRDIRQGGRYVEASRARYQAMLDAFDVAREDGPDLELEPGDIFGRRRYLRQLFNDTVRAYEQVRSPFAGYLEAPPILIHMNEKYGRRIHVSIEEATTVMLDMLEGIVGRLWAIGADERITEDDLRMRGYDPADYPPRGEDDW
jgi:hypothetical protein